MMAGLNQPDGAISASPEVGGKFAQDLVGILVLFVDQRRKIALGIKHGAP
jgi:hypothetical protein